MTAFYFHTREQAEASARRRETRTGWTYRVTPTGPVGSPPAGWLVERVSEAPTTIGRAAARECLLNNDT